uniref:Uncharacterized protein n=1 Tax=Lactuca sativa TaxID=4236 RepID=A0A9R1W7N6_LACSA|nr:hypothetical protein LSAT_V11C300143160 [Lactuca sativa]
MVISGKILQLESVTQSEAMRRRYRYLSHFSLTTMFQYLWVSIVIVSEYFITSGRCLKTFRTRSFVINFIGLKRLWYIIQDLDCVLEVCKISRISRKLYLL